MNQDLQKKIQCCARLQAEIEIWNNLFDELRKGERLPGNSSYARRMNDLADDFIQGAKIIQEEELGNP